MPQAPKLFTEPHPWRERTTDPHDFVVAQMIHSGAHPGAHVGLFGAPFDLAVIGRPGARGGPDAIRRELALLKPHTFAHGAFESDVSDWGNVRFMGETTREAHADVEGCAREILAANAIPLCLGGDHSLAAPLIRAHGHDAHLGVINLDAHLDVRESEKITSGSPFRLLIDEGYIAPRNFVEVGIREFATSAHYGGQVKKAGITVITPDEIAEQGTTAIATRALEHALDGRDRFYLSIDIDVLDQVHGPGVSAPSPGGITSRELMSLTRKLAASGKVAGACLVETAPSLDARDGRTVRAAAWTIMALLAGLAEARATKRRATARNPPEVRTDG